MVTETLLRANAPGHESDETNVNKCEEPQDAFNAARHFGQTETSRANGGATAQRRSALGW